MTNRGNVSDDDLRADLLWKLARRHGWSGWVSEDALVDKALKDSQAPRGRNICKELRKENYVICQRSRGYRIKGMPEQEELAEELRKYGYGKMRIEATLSPFERSGGFDS